MKYTVFSLGTIVRERLPDFKFQVFQDVAHCTTAFIDERVWLQSTCILGLQKTTEGRTTRKEASIADNLST